MTTRERLYQVADQIGVAKCDREEFREVAACTIPAEAHFGPGDYDMSECEVYISEGLYQQIESETLKEKLDDCGKWGSIGDLRAIFVG